MNIVSALEWRPSGEVLIFVKGVVETPLLMRNLLLSNLADRRESMLDLRLLETLMHICWHVFGH